ncbi:MAG: hypothetical protein KDA63_17590 [Planctomycetales bacterium]|nr:hypothetical protein [Planctomycetales bacterium]
MALTLLSGFTVLYGLVCGAALLGIWFWTEGTRRLVVITVAAVVSVVARESLMPFLQGERQAIGIVAGIVLGALDIREIEFWRRLRAAQWVVRWPSWRVFRPNLCVRLICVLPAVLVLSFVVSLQFTHWRQARLIADIERFGGSVRVGRSHRPLGKLFNLTRSAEIFGAQVGTSAHGRMAAFVSELSTSPSSIADRPPNATSDYVDGIIRRLGRSKELDTLMIADPEVTDSAFSTFTGMDALDQVRICCPLVTDRGLTFLAKCPRLRELDLTGTPVTGQLFAQSGAVAPLQTLNVSGTQFTDQATSQLPQFGSLYELNLSGTPITDAAVPNLAKCLGLRFLDLSDTDVTDAGLADLAACTSLKGLLLKNCNVSVPGLAQLGTGCRLGSLDLSGCDLSDDDLTGLLSLSGLRALSLQHAHLSESALSELTAIKTLQQLDLSNTNVSDAGIEALREFPDFGYSVFVKNVVDRTANLPTPTPQNTMRIENHSGWISLKHTAITDRSLEVLASLRSIDGLDLTGTKITDAGIAQLANLPHLRTLVISETEVGDAGLKLLTQCPSLTLVGIENTPVTDAGIKQLRAARPDIELLPPQPSD